MIKVEHYEKVESYSQTGVYDNKELLGASWRSKLMEALVRFHYRSYSRSHYKNKEAWDVTVKDLLVYPKDSLGYQMGNFLQIHNFHVIPKFENHDVFHVVLSYTPLVTDEIRMQFCLAGSGRRTLSTFATMIIGSGFYPEYIGSFIKAYRRGLFLNNFSYQEFKPLLDKSLCDLQEEVGCDRYKNLCRKTA